MEYLGKRLIVYVKISFRENTVIDITGYHGTKKSRCMKILETHEWIPSTGIRHWLGDGIYFFESKDDAINWTARFKDESAI